MRFKLFCKITTILIFTGLFSACGPQGFDRSSVEEDFSAAVVDTSDEIPVLPDIETLDFELPEDPQKTAKDEKTAPQGASDIAATGVVKPTIYYFPNINEDELSCKASSSLSDKNGTLLARVCAQTQQACALQGSCAVVQKNRLRTFNVVDRINGKDRFFETTDDECKFGYGVKSFCLDPFYTVAADLRFYKPGDVIYIPALRGLELPNGHKHNGYFIVRDKGRSILGKGRFDFFSGYYSWLNDENPFTKAGLGDKTNRLRYYKVKGATAKAVLQHREFPKIPENSINIEP